MQADYTHTHTPHTDTKFFVFAADTLAPQARHRTWESFVQDLWWFRVFGSGCASLDWLSFPTF